MQSIPCDLHKYSTTFLKLPLHPILTPPSPLQNTHTQTSNNHIQKIINNTKMKIKQNQWKPTPISKPFPKPNPSYPNSSLDTELDRKSPPPSPKRKSHKKVPAKNEKQKQKETNQRKQITDLSSARLSQLRSIRSRFTIPRAKSVHPGHCLRARGLKRNVRRGLVEGVASRGTTVSSVTLFRIHFRV